VTIALSLKVNDGVVLAADSATTLFSLDDQGDSAAVVNIYNNANKVFNLLKGVPVGAITWGSGSIGVASISTLVKDLRQRFAGESMQHLDWKIDRKEYTVEAVAKRFREFMFDELYEPAFQDWPKKPDLGFIVAGYSSGSGMAEEYQISIQSGACGPPAKLRGSDDAGVTWSGEPEAITRLVMGYGTTMSAVLTENLGVPLEQVPQVMEILSKSLQAPLVMAAMPIQDAIDLAQFLVETTVKFSRFTPGAPTVGGPVEVAAITKHEGFKWVCRKHYYREDFNPPYSETGAKYV